MKHRNLRIAWSVAWGLLAVLLCVLWVRSYSTCDVVGYGLQSSTTLFLETAEGRLCLARVVAANGGNSDGFDFHTLPPTGVKPWDSDQLSECCGVRYKVYSTGTVLIDFPLGYVLALSIVASVVPWISFRRFSLRTLLIATTLVAVALGLIVWANR